MHGERLGRAQGDRAPPPASVPRCRTRARGRAGRAPADHREGKGGQQVADAGLRRPLLSRASSSAGKASSAASTASSRRRARADPRRQREQRQRLRADRRLQRQRRQVEPPPAAMRTWPKRYARCPGAPAADCWSRPSIHCGKRQRPRLRHRIRRASPPSPRQAVDRPQREKRGGREARAQRPAGGGRRGRSPRAAPTTTSTGTRRSAVTLQPSARPQAAPHAAARLGEGVSTKAHGRPEGRAPGKRPASRPAWPASRWPARSARSTTARAPGRPRPRRSGAPPARGAGPPADRHRDRRRARRRRGTARSRRSRRDHNKCVITRCHSAGVWRPAERRRGAWPREAPFRQHRGPRVDSEVARAPRGARPRRGRSARRRCPTCPRRWPAARACTAASRPPPSMLARGHRLPSRRRTRSERLQPGAPHVHLALARTCGRSAGPAGTSRDHGAQAGRSFSRMSTMHWKPASLMNSVPQRAKRLAQHAGAVGAVAAGEVAHAAAWDRRAGRAGWPRG